MKALTPEELDARLKTIEEVVIRLARAQTVAASPGTYFADLRGMLTDISVYGTDVPDVVDEMAGNLEYGQDYEDVDTRDAFDYTLELGL